MKKYWLLFKLHLQDILIYRLSFLLGSLRQFLSFVILFSVWSAAFRYQTTLYHYSFDHLITYLFGTIILQSLIFSSRSYELASVINNGYLSIYLLKPINLFGYYFTRDLADKLTNLFFLFLELILLYFLFKPSLFFPSDKYLVIYFLLFFIIAILLFFYLSLIFGMIGFWSKETWAPRFLFFIILEFATGSLFPLDMLPSSFQNFFKFTPFPYLIFFPIQAYLGKLKSPLSYFIISLAWLIIFYLLTSFIWKKGLKRYEAEGY